MTELEEVFQDFEWKFGLDNCTVCMGPTVMRDIVGFPWCAEHEHHGKVLTWGRRHGYPELDLYKYIIAPGEHSWWLAAVASASADEAYMWTALAYIEDLERQKAS